MRSKIKLRNVSTRQPVSRFSIVLYLVVGVLFVGCANGAVTATPDALESQPPVSRAVEEILAPRESPQQNAAALAPTPASATPTAPATATMRQTATPDTPVIALATVAASPTATVTISNPKTTTAAAQATLTPRQTVTATKKAQASPTAARAKSTATPNAPQVTPTNAADKAVVHAADGVHLLFDDYWIAERKNVTRTVMSPQREFQTPVVSSGEGFNAWQSYLTVLYDKNNARAPFRMWYNASIPDSALYIPGTLAYLESKDGIHWNGPAKRFDTFREIFGASIVDRGANARPRDERYKMVYWQWPGDPPRAPNSAGMQRATSPDGLNWTVKPNMPFGNMVVNNDIWNMFWDPATSRYGVFFKDWVRYQWTNAAGKKQNTLVRLVGYSTSADFEKWSAPVHMFVPDAHDDGITQFYGVGGVQRRGDLLIGFLKVLRDDVTVAGAPPQAKIPNGGEGGMGYTVLAWSRDGVTWQRDRAANAFFKPDPQVGAWDHAMAWIDSAVPVNNQVYLYYGGYRWGHKYNQATERQIGLLRIPRDRYVAQTAGNAQGLLVTRPMTFDAEKLFLNVKSNRGRVEFEVRDEQNNPLPGFTFADCKPIKIDNVSQQVQCAGKFADLKETPVRLAFRMQNAQLYSFGLQ